MATATRRPAMAVDSLVQALGEELDALAPLSPEELRRAREDRFLAIGRN